MVVASNLGQYLPIVLMMGLATAFAAGSFVASGLLAPRSPNDRKRAPYEWGIIPAKETPERFPVRFFLIAMIFIVFDIEIIFFYPWAIAHKEVGWFGAAQNLASLTRNSTEHILMPPAPCTSGSMQTPEYFFFLELTSFFSCFKVSTSRPSLALGSSLLKG